MEGRNVTPNPSELRDSRGRGEFCSSCYFLGTSCAQKVTLKLEDGCGTGGRWWLKVFSEKVNASIRRDSRKHSFPAREEELGTIHMGTTSRT